MIVNAAAVVLSRRAFRENDRLCSVFTEHLGKIPARFVGVNRPKGKMKALTEPGVWGEYRLHLSSRSEYAKGVGGRLISSFPGWRTDLARTFDALACLEMLDRLTPDHQPSPEKYALICAALGALDAAPSQWLVPAFGLRLAEMLGISLRERAPAACLPYWNVLHDEALDALPARRYDAAAGDAARRVLDEHFAAHAGRRLRAFEFRDEWKKTVPLGVPA